MFQVIEKTETFNARGRVIDTKKRVVLETECPIAMLKRCYEIDPVLGYCVTQPFAGMKTFVSLERSHDGSNVTFADIFRSVEGAEAYDTAMNSEDGFISEKEWVAAK